MTEGLGDEGDGFGVGGDNDGRTPLDGPDDDASLAVGVRGGVLSAI